MNPIHIVVAAPLLLGGCTATSVMNNAASYDDAANPTLGVVPSRYQTPVSGYTARMPVDPETLARSEQCAGSERRPVMMTRPFTLGSKLAAILSLPLFLSGCVSAAQYASRDAGFTTVSAKTSEATGKQTAWVQNRAEARATEARVKTLMAASKTLDVETAVQVALLNNKGLQAAYADLGESAATAWQSTLLVNPSIGLGLTGIGTPGLRAYKTIEGVLTSNILALATLKKMSKLPIRAFARRSWARH